MTENENRPQDPEADLAHSRQSIKEAKEAAEQAHLADADDGDAPGEAGFDPGMRAD
ncbi:hypothetical protein [Amycolatopsis sp. NPDC049159]|uniref:hypothetical protein n=1 Tax=unclassified Amycolatopsis TaxID=2618356 RepID=UPI0033C162DA